jgi:hypothetical protein
MSGHAAVQPTPHADVIFTDLDGVEGVLVDLNTKQYFQLNETACFVWRGLAQGAALETIANDLTEQYDVSLDRARQSVEAAVGTFTAHRLVGA